MLSSPVPPCFNPQVHLGPWAAGAFSRLHGQDYYSDCCPRNSALLRGYGEKLMKLKVPQQLGKMRIFSSCSPLNPFHQLHAEMQELALSQQSKKAWQRGQTEVSKSLYLLTFQFQNPLLVICGTVDCIINEGNRSKFCKTCSKRNYLLVIKDPRNFPLKPLTYLLKVNLTLNNTLLVKSLE